MVAANVLMIAVFAIGLQGGVSTLAFVGILLFTAGFDFGFGALAVVSFGYVLWLAPETKGRPLEDIRLYWQNGGKWPVPPATTGSPG